MHTTAHEARDRLNRFHIAPSQRAGSGDGAFVRPRLPATQEAQQVRFEAIAARQEQSGVDPANAGRSVPLQRVDDPQLELIRIMPVENKRTMTDNERRDFY